jgi:hypothetical protein
MNDDPVTAALDNSQSLLTMIYQLNTNGSVSEHDWEAEGLSDLIIKQIKENRAALSPPASFRRIYDKMQRGKVTADDRQESA